MKAPSEKHLEDYLWTHPEALGMIGIPPQYGPDSPRYNLWFRQFHVPSGIIDLLGCNYRVCAFELKKGILTAQSLTQLMRYMFDVRNMVERLMMDWFSEPGPLQNWAKQYWDPNSAHGAMGLVGGVLIGHDYENDNLLTACAGCDIDVLIYDYDGVTYKFEECGVNYRALTVDYYAQMQALIYGDFGQEYFNAYRTDILKNHSDEIKKHNAEFDAVSAAEDYIERTDGHDSSINPNSE